MQGVRVNLGCGHVYKPGFLNVDKYISSVADILVDALALPFPDGSVDLIEADQLLEHLDSAHARLALLECRRVLTARGRLVLEMPDLRETLSRLVSARPSQYDAELLWIYGLDSPGLQHKTGFTKESLVRMLTESALEVQTFEKPRTHTYEPGLRVVCRRADAGCGPSTAVAGAISSLALDGAFGDSLVLVPLCDELLRGDGAEGGDNMQVLSRACVLNPRVASAILRKLDITSGPSKRDLEEILRRMAEVELHERAFTLWKRSSKVRGDAVEFDAFVKRLIHDVRVCLEDGDSELTTLSYILSLPPTPIPLLEHRLAMIQAQKSAGLGVRLFAAGDHDLAAEAFQEALAMHPPDFSSAVNLGRLMSNSGAEATATERVYLSAIAHAPRGVKNRIRRELSEYKRTGRTPCSPFSA